MNLFHIQKEGLNWLSLLDISWVQAYVPWERTNDTHMKNIAKYYDEEF